MLNMKHLVVMTHLRTLGLIQDIKPFFIYNEIYDIIDIKTRRI